MTKERQNFPDAQRRTLARYGVETQSRFVDIPSIGGRAHVLVAGAGPAVVMVNGTGTPGAMWAPLMAELEGFRLLAVDLPAYGLTDVTRGFADDLPRNSVHSLCEVIDARSS